MRILDAFEQGSMEWHQARCGKVTMSRAKDLLTQGKGKTRQSYILDVAAERLSGESIEGYYGLDMERGNFLEPHALQAFTEATGQKMQTVGFVLHDDERIGCSPDALSEPAGVEIKCPKPRQHLRNIYGDGMKDYYPQAQGCMWVCERKHWYIVSFCPWVKQRPIHIELIERDDALIERLAVSAIDAADEVDCIVGRAVDADLPRSVFDTAENARSLWENAIATNDEVRL